ncbi:MAG: polyphosphate:AMP phosphotransferase [Magnetovibrio sp.]|nr:polyphosphate:AMP phosphotransferase [Magnetovibrio sp.]
MFEAAELGHKVSKATYKTEVPKLREQLLDAQFELGEKKPFPVVIIVSGVDGAGKGEAVNTLNFWMDPRNIHAHALGDPTDEELERPAMWRYWRKLPPKGAIGFFFGSWYSHPMRMHIDGGKSRDYLDSYLDDFLRFERMLADEGALVLKFWLHLSKDALKDRLTQLEGDKATNWRVTKKDWERYERYDDLMPVAEHVLRRTSTGHAPWIVVESTDEKYRNLTVGRTLLKAVKARLAEQGKPATASVPVQALDHADDINLLDALDYTKTLEKKAYKKELEKYQGRLNKLTRSKAFRDRGMVLVFEGNDAAGKGGSIRRACAAMDSRFYDIIPIAAPTDEEKAQPYLWRFWRHLPGIGKTAIFDRSWYGRVLVERVEGFCSEADWLRAYGEINDFEEEMARHGIIVQKFWLSITADEQLHRFNEREATGYKRFKLTDEDWRNRDKWSEYSNAVCDMVERTSTEIAPWTLVEANSKYYARIKVLKTLCKRLEEEL